MANNLNGFQLSDTTKISSPISEVAGNGERPLRANSRLERVLSSGRFAVTAEIHAPDSADPADLYKNALVLSEVCDGINATDGSGANCHMSSLACSTLMVQAGYEPIFQMGCRDRNRIAMQGDLLGAAALGVQNVLCLTGDDVTAGDQPEAKRVFDFDCMHLLRTARIMRDKGIFLSGRKLEKAPRFFLGAAANPFVPPFDWRPLRMAKKVEAGADFIQTQYCYDVPRLVDFMRHVRDLGLHERVYILVGVGPLRSEKAAEFMRTKVPGVWIPNEVVDRLAKTPKGKKVEEGKQICIEIIQQVREIEGVHGVHIMAYRQEKTVAEIVHRAALLPRKVPHRLESDGRPRRYQQRSQA
ncbi:MAG: methylenetetrahydrofolate reductase [Chloroflexota bacterium]